MRPTVEPGIWTCRRVPGFQWLAETCYNPEAMLDFGRWMRAGAGSFEIMKDGTRLIFWIDIVVLLVLAALILAGQWDFVIALFLALVIMNYFDRWRKRRSRD